MALSRLQWVKSDTSSQTAETGLDAQLNAYNLPAMLDRAPAVYSALRFDPNITCNVQCVYCHNHRSSDIVPTNAFLRIITGKIVTLHTFPMGCVMEPTLDARMCDLLVALRQSPARPTDATILQTNGILLHQHDSSKLRDAGLTHLALSIDAAEPDLVRFGLDLGVSRFVLREVFYHPESTVVDHARMPGLLLRDGDYAAMAASLTAEFGSQTEFDFADRAVLERIDQTTRRDSLRD
jgi:hypothetical protein